MVFDPGLAERIRHIVADRPGISERRMFGGIAFLLDGRMAVGISGTDLMARVGPERHREALARPHVREMDFTGRAMRGYVFVGAAALADDPALQAWVDECLAFVATLPARPASPAPKRPRAGATRKSPR